MALTKITSDGITDATISASDLASNCVTRNKISDGEVISSKLDSSAVTTSKINNNAVTYSKIQNVSATNRILGRDSSGAGVIEEITPSNLRTMLNVADGATNVTNTNQLTNGAGYLTDLVNDTSPSLGGDLDMNSKSISSGILGIKNTGSQSEVRLYCEVSNAHYIAIKAPPHAQFSGNPVFQLPPNGGTNGYFLTTNGSGVTSWAAVSGITDKMPLSGGIFTGDVTFDGATAGKDIFFDRSQNAFEFQDGAACRFGTDNDLALYHDGANSYLHETGTGQLRLLTNQFRLNNAANNENIISADANGAVELYHDNSKKFETTSAGATVTGTLTATAFSGNGASLTNVNAATLGSITAGQFMRDDQNQTATGLITLTTGLALGNNAKCTAAFSSLTDGSTITVDFASGIHHSTTISGNRTLSHTNTSITVGQSGSIVINQDATGSRTLAFNSAYKFVGGTAPTLSTAANAKDRIDYVVIAANEIHAVVTLDVK